MSALNGVANNINKAAHKGFYHSSSGGKGPVNAVGLCPAYVTPDNCAGCVKKSIPLLMLKCPNQKEGVTWVADCIVRYSDRKILGVLDDWIWIHLTDSKSVAKVGEMDQALSTLATGMKGQVADGSSIQKFMYAQITYGPDPNFVKANTVYVAMQCTPDLSKEQCSKCLMSTILTVYPCCSGKVSASMLSPNCYLRYDHTKFDNK